MNNELGDRTQYIGGSDIAAIMGKSPWKTRSGLLREKITQERRNFSTAATRFGHDKERPLIEFDALTADYELADDSLVMENPSFGPVSFAFPVICHFDGIGTMPDGEKILIECKTSSTPFRGVLPEHYRPQVQFYLAALGLKRARIVFGQRDGDQIGETDGFFVDADPDYFKNEIVPAVAQFCRDVIDGRARLAAGETIENILGDVVCDAVTLMGETPVAQVNKALALIDRLTAMVNEFKAALKQKMTDDGITRAEFGNYTATISAPSTRKSVDIDALKRDYPGVAERYITETKVAGSLRITKKKGKE